MENQLTIGSLIKRHIKMRGKTTKQVAKALGRNYTTFCGILNRNAVDAELLFELANYLDIDLIWMSQLFDHRKAISSLERYQMPRMNSDFRKHEYGDVCDQLDLCIKNNPDSIAEARRELIATYPNVFYLLDVLMPENDVIRITVERGKEKYYCIPLEANTHTRGRGLQQIYDGNEMLNRLILQRKEELL